MTEEQDTKATQRHRKTGHGLFFWIVIPFPFVAFGLCWILFAVTIEYLHYWVGAVLSFILGAAAVGLVIGTVQHLWIERFENPLPLVTFTSNVSMLATAVSLLLTVGAWISFTLIKVGLADLSDVSAELGYGQLVRTYGWHLIDLIPFTNVEKTFGMKEPLVQFKGWAGGTPILVFRLLVVAIILNAVYEAWKLFRSKSEDLFVERIRKAVDEDSLRKNSGRAPEPPVSIP